jgi:hypothetical protein
VQFLCLVHYACAFLDFGVNKRLTVVAFAMSHRECAEVAAPYHLMSWLPLAACWLH